MAENKVEKAYEVIRQYESKMGQMQKQIKLLTQYNNQLLELDQQNQKLLQKPILIELKRHFI